MTYSLTIEERRRYRANEVKKHGIFELNRMQALRRALKTGSVTDMLKDRYGFTMDDLPFLVHEVSSDSDTPHSPTDKASSVGSEITQT
jgi:hypothetical protein